MISKRGRNMLELYLKDIEYTRFNDVYFDKHITQINFENATIKKIIQNIDKVKYIGNYRVLSKFEKDTAISVRELSTGCKTALNIASFTDKIFSVAECGDNALQVIFNYKHGKIFMPMFSIPREFTNKIEVHTAQGKQIIDNNEQLEAILNTVF